MTNTASIFIRDLRVELSVGIYDAEKIKPQSLIFNITATMDLPKGLGSIETANISQVLDYDSIRTFIVTELPKRGHIPLLETVAEQILSFAMTDKRITKISVRIEKPEIYVDTTGLGVEVTRLRD